MMPYSYAGTSATYGSAYQVAKAVESGALFEVAKRLYSDERHPDPNAVTALSGPRGAGSDGIPAMKATALGDLA